MPPVFLALLTSAVTAVSRVFLKKGFEKSNPVTGMFVSLVICGVFLSFLTLAVVPHKEYTLKGILFFAFIGVFAPPVVRYLTYIGVDKLGAARSEPVRSITPFFAIFLAVLFLHEPVNFFIVTGTFLIVLGVLTLSKKGNRQYIKEWKKRYLFFPLTAAFLAGVAANLRKYGFNLLTSPILAAAATALSALLVFTAYLLISGKKKELSFDKYSLKFFTLASLCTGLSVIFNLMALKYGKVTVISPLLATSPLFILLFSHLFLKKAERVTFRTILGALFIFIGVELVILFRP